MPEENPRLQVAETSADGAPERAGVERPMVALFPMQTEGDEDARVARAVARLDWVQPGWR